MLVVWSHAHLAWVIYSWVVHNVSSVRVVRPSFGHRTTCSTVSPPSSMCLLSTPPTQRLLYVPLRLQFLSLLAVLLLSTLRISL
jgi:hypothetical protein